MPIRPALRSLHLRATSCGILNESQAPCHAPQGPAGEPRGPLLLFPAAGRPGLVLRALGPAGTTRLPQGLCPCVDLCLECSQLRSLAGWLVGIMHKFRSERTSPSAPLKPLLPAPHLCGADAACYSSSFPPRGWLSSGLRCYLLSLSLSLLLPSVSPPQTSAPGSLLRPQC